MPGALRGVRGSTASIEHRGSIGNRQRPIAGEKLGRRVADGDVHPDTGFGLNVVGADDGGLGHGAALAAMVAACSSVPGPRKLEARLELRANRTLLDPNGTPMGPR